MLRYIKLEPKTCLHTLLETSISLPKGALEDDFPFPKVGYVSLMEGIHCSISGSWLEPFKIRDPWNHKATSLLLDVEGINGMVPNQATFLLFSKMWVEAEPTTLLFFAIQNDWVSHHPFRSWYIGRFLEIAKEYLQITKYEGTDIIYSCQVYDISPTPKTSPEGKSFRTLLG